MGVDRPNYRPDFGLTAEHQNTSDEAPVSTSLKCDLKLLAHLFDNVVNLYTDNTDNTDGKPLISSTLS